jgi:hypothetical protein
MQRGHGVWDQEKTSEDACIGAGIVQKCIRRVADNKYSDLILLCFIITGFGALLILSSLG